MSKINSKSKPMREEFEERFKLEDEPYPLVEGMTVRQDTYLYWNKIHRFQLIGQRYSKMATEKIGQDAIKWLEEYNHNWTKNHGKKRNTRK